MQLVRLSSKGQLTIPAALREVLGLEQGDELLLNAEEGKLVLQPIKYKNLEALFSAVHSKHYISDKDVQSIVRTRTTSRDQ
jgi:AbrB family looped-hinge helix DNA binding protein